MELIYFILGFLFTVTGYGIVLLTKTKSSHTSLLGELHACRDLTHQQFDSSVAKHNKLEGDIKKISEYYIDVRITELAELFNEQGNRNKRLFDMADKQLRQQQNEIQQATNTLKKIVDDPTTLARY